MFNPFKVMRGIAAVDHGFKPFGPGLLNNADHKRVSYEVNDFR